MNNRMAFVCFFLLGLSVNPAYSKEQRLIINTIASNLGIPWGMALTPHNTMLITQREGILSELDLATGEIKTIEGLPTIKVEGQGGLFDVQLSPEYTEQPWIYFSYNKDIDGQGATTLARAKIEDNRLVEWQDIFISQSRTKKKVHYAGRITFDQKGHLFFAIGERGVRENAQNLSNHAGTIVRLNLNGSIPDDNPFINNPNALDEIWSYGHRNPQGLFFNHDTQQLWSVEHGPRGGDEINLISAGHNYGWPIISYGKEYWGPLSVGEGTKRKGMEQPIKKYVPSIATSSLIQYRGDAFPDWQNNLFIGALKSQHLNRIVLDQDNQAIAESRLLRSIKGRIRNVIESPEGWLYIATDNGRILAVKPHHSVDNEYP